MTAVGHPVGTWRAEAPPSCDDAHRDTLDRNQVGHLRHIRNLAEQPRGDWAHMGTKMHGQEDFGSYRFQLAYMAYALALTHVHRLPNAPGVFRTTFEGLLEKLLHPDVWLYWRNVSQGGHAFNAHLRETLQERWNPVERDNIMYSAYLQSLFALYEYLFNDKKYAQPESIVLEHASQFWGYETHRFAYDRRKLNELIYWKMVESGYLGIACEPNCVFQICNQPAILGFRINDLLDGTDLASDVTRSYRETWSEYGQIGENGHFNMCVLEDSKTLIPNPGPFPWIDGWTGALMNTWNRDLLRQWYPAQICDVVEPRPDGLLSVKLSPSMENEGRALDYDTGDFGFVAMWASEMGDEETLGRLLRYADQFMNPTWSRGGLHYPRHDPAYDADGNLVRVEPITGNALLAYARLNVPDGMWGLYNRPWRQGHFQEPLVDEVSGMDVVRAWFDPRSGILDVGIGPAAASSAPQRMTLANIFDRPGGDWIVELDGVQVAHGDAADVLGRQGVAARRTPRGLELELACDRPAQMKVRLANGALRPA